MTKRKLLISTSNSGKLAEIRSAFKELPFEIIGLAEAGLPADFDVEEPAKTFEGNAIIKAMTIGAKTGLLTLADDSGLEVDVLGGRPGVHSARYGTSSEDRRRRLLEDLAGVPGDKRGAQFHCVIAIFDPQTMRVRTCEGISRGTILKEKRGENGFGFDPLFLDESLGKTYAEMSMEQKASISHRGKALVRAYRILTFSEDFD